MGEVTTCPRCAGTKVDPEHPERCGACLGRGVCVTEKKDDVPGPLEQALIDQIKAGAKYVRVDTSDDLARLYAEVKARRSKHWRTQAEGNSPPDWADLMFHGVPLVCGRILIHCDTFVDAMELLREVHEKGTSIDMNVRIREFLTRMRFPCS